ncbi:hypothetical protein H5410_057224 [Solanum commersonii]|uniref:Uncharacterized protein n=1 Tax=Solanum commersonii TaxID=4109 RepID=A0A9J5WNG2_SOLCO|nr:hypothetical protein H5410_057224 [Solanum commersonii]
MQVQAQPKCSNVLTQRMIPYSHNGLPIFSNQHLLKLTQDHKGLSRLVMRLSTKTQQDTKSPHIVYATSFGLIVAAHSC